jgi:protein-L-isoaspartate O-methyltransferase
MTVISKDQAGRVSRRNIEAVRFVPLRMGTA